MQNVDPSANSKQDTLAWQAGKASRKPRAANSDLTAAVTGAFIRSK